MTGDTYARFADTSSIADHLLRKTNVRDLLIQMMSRTNKTGLEHGIVLIRDGDGIVSTPIQTGNNGSITLRYRGEPLATAHTHPDEQYERLFSYADIKSYINSPMQFAYLTYDDGDITLADVYQTDKYNTFNQLVQDYGRSLPSLRDINDDLLQQTVELGQW